MILTSALWWLISLPPWQFSLYTGLAAAVDAAVIYAARKA
jgi:hypothetical protein